MVSDFIATSNMLPEKNRLIEWIAPSGHGPIRGKYIGGIVWMIEDGMIVYYTPLSWRYI